MKVLFTNNYPAPYKVDFYNLLGKYCNVTVSFEEKFGNQKNRNKEWFNTKYDHFDAVFLKNHRLLFFKNDENNPLTIAPSIVKEVKKDYDFVITGIYSFSAILAILYMQLKKRPYWITVDGWILTKSSKIQDVVKKFLLKKAVGYFSPGAEVDAYLLKYGAEKNQIYRYPFSSYFEKDILKKAVTCSEKEKLRQKLKMTEEKIVISVGQFIYRKGFDVLLNAFSQVNKNIGLYIIGGNPPAEFKEMRAHLHLEDNVHFVPFMAKEELKKYYMAADLFVLPTREDCWGLVINEAMSYGLPVITTNMCTAGLELIENGVNGYIVQNENHLEMQEKIEQILLEDDYYKMGQNSLQKIKNYTLENMALTYYKILESNKKNTKES